MGLTMRLAEAAGISAKKIGSLELIASKDVSAFLRAAKDRNVVILGVEGFRTEGNHVVPDMDAIADFSGLPHDGEMVATTIEEAGRFLLEFSQPDMYFDFTFDGVENDR